MGGTSVSKDQDKNELPLVEAIKSKQIPKEISRSELTPEAMKALMDSNDPDLIKEVLSDRLKMTGKEIAEYRIDDPDRPIPGGYSPFEYAMSRETSRGYEPKLKSAEALIEINKDACNIRKDANINLDRVVQTSSAYVDGFTPLTYFVSNANLKATENMLDNGADPNFQSSNGLPLHRAFYNIDAERPANTTREEIEKTNAAKLTNLLMERGANLDASVKGNTLQDAVMKAQLNKDKGSRQQGPRPILYDILLDKQKKIIPQKDSVASVVNKIHDQIEKADTVKRNIEQVKDKLKEAEDLKSTLPEKPSYKRLKSYRHAIKEIEKEVEKDLSTAKQMIKTTNEEFSKAVQESLNAQVELSGALKEQQLARSNLKALQEKAQAAEKTGNQVQHTAAKEEVAKAEQKVKELQGKVSKAQEVASIKSKDSAVASMSVKAIQRLYSKDEIDKLTEKVAQLKVEANQAKIDRDKTVKGFATKQASTAKGFATKQLSRLKETLSMSPKNRDARAASTGNIPNQSKPQPEQPVKTVKTKLSPVAAELAHTIKREFFAEDNSTQTKNNIGIIARDITKALGEQYVKDSHDKVATAIYAAILNKSKRLSDLNLNATQQDVIALTNNVKNLLPPPPLLPETPKKEKERTGAAMAQATASNLSSQTPQSPKTHEVQRGPSAPALEKPKDSVSVSNNKINPNLREKAQAIGTMLKNNNRINASQSLSSHANSRKNEQGQSR